MRRLLFLAILFLALMPGCEAEEGAPAETQDAASSKDWVGDAVVEWSESPDAEEEGQWKGGAMEVPEFLQWPSE